MKPDAKPESVRRRESRYASQIQGETRMENVNDVIPAVKALCSPQVVSSVNNTPAPSAMNIIKKGLIPAPASGVVTKASN